jgi:hypothetical protein
LLSTEGDVEGMGLSFHVLDKKETPRLIQQELNSSLYLLTLNKVSIMIISFTLSVLILN